MLAIVGSDKLDADTSAILDAFEDSDYLCVVLPFPLTDGWRFIISNSKLPKIIVSASTPLDIVQEEQNYFQCPAVTFVMSEIRPYAVPTEFLKGELTKWLTHHGRPGLS